MKLFFSVIVPTLNEEKFLPKLLDRLVKQKTKNFEVIVVDGKSEDKTKEISEKAKKVLKLEFLETEEKNVSLQRNLGAQKAKGEYLIFLDADIGISPTFTQKLESIILRKKGLILLPSLLPDEQKPETKAIFKMSNKIIEASQALGRPIPAPGALIIEKNIFLKIGGYDEKISLAEDHEILKRAQEWGVRAKFLPTLTVRFSLRRAKKEGRFKTLYKFALSTSHILFTGTLKEKIFEYEMGGKYHLEADKKKDYAQDYLNKIKEFFLT